MSARAIYESHGKFIIYKNFENGDACQFMKPLSLSVNADTFDADFNNVDEKTSQWLNNRKLVVKPDQLIKRRGKLGLIKVNCTLQDAKQWIKEHMSKDIKIEKACGKLTNFIIEPFIPHQDKEEYYVCIYSERSCDSILFSTEGGVDIGSNVEEKSNILQIPVDLDDMSDEEMENLVSEKLLNNIKDQTEKKRLTTFVRGLYRVYTKLYFTYLEINPLVVSENGIYMLDLAAKLDATADFLCRSLWTFAESGQKAEYPPPFGREALPEEAYVADIDAKTGASLKLTVLNANGRIWTMVAGGGASVIYADTVCSLLAENGKDASELANYGEYSGAPSEQQTYDYAKTILSLLIKSEAKDKVLLIGGGIANFTNVAATFKGIVKALEEFQTVLKESEVRIFVRRAGPNYQEGLRVMRDIGVKLELEMHVFGPETHMTAIVEMALSSKNEKMSGSSGSECLTASASKTSGSSTSAHITTNFLLPSSSSSSPMTPERRSSHHDIDGVLRNGVHGNTTTTAGLLSKGGETSVKDHKIVDPSGLFNRSTKAIVWGLQTKAVQGMMDFDYVCQRSTPSVACMVYPMVGGDSKQNFYWGHKEVLVPVYKHMSDAMLKHRDADVLVNFASLRSAYDSTLEAITLYSSQIRTIAIIAEGIPENMTRKLIKIAQQFNVTIIGPATVGGIKPGCFKIGNTGGMMDNLLHSKLYRPGSVAYVSRSGGMSNELNNIICHTSDGVYEGIAIGGDAYPVSTFLDHLIRYEKDENVKLLVVLGEVGGTEEYRICEAMKDGRLTKPIVAWCIGTCADMFTTDVQFGHAGASAGGKSLASATSKNAALKAAGAHVPNSFNDLGHVIKQQFNLLVERGNVILKEEVAPPPVPMDYAWARELGLIRRPASFMTSICDERGQELIYAGMPITQVFKEEMGIGGVLSLLWFQRRLPPYACQFLEMCLMVTADHGPAVSGAHNTIVCARAGKDLVSSLVSGLLTIGDRFGGALDGAAKHFTEAYDSNLDPMQFVNSMRKKGEIIMGIGHRVKSINNPDMRVSLIIEYVKTKFPSTPLLDYALEVQAITTTKKPNLILNVDGCIAVCFVDLLRHSGCFTKDEADLFVETGSLNGLFVLGRTVGFIGHYLDQKRLKQGLYRHPWDDISYVLPELQQ